MAGFKELNCLYRVAKIIAEETDSVESILLRIPDTIVDGWQHSDVACARVVLEGQLFQTANFSGYSMEAGEPILVNGEESGRIEVCYFTEMPEADEGPFLRDERLLLEAIAERLGKVVWKCGPTKR